MVLVYFRSPSWFYGLDSLLEVIIIITAFMISFYSYKIFSVLKSRNHKYFSVAFFLIGFAYVFKIFSSIILYKTIKPSFHLLLDPLTASLYSVEIVHFFSFFLFKLLTAFGFLLLFLIAVDVVKKALILVDMYIIFLAVVFSSLFATTAYHTILISFLFFICWYYYNNYLRIKSKASYRILIAFLFMFLAQLIFPIDFSIFYVLGEILLITGFLVLLYNQIKLTAGK